MKILVSVVLLATATPALAGSLSGKVTWRGTTDYSNAVVYAEKIPKDSVPPPNYFPVLDQISLTFVPHVLPVLVGTTVSFPNSDEGRHSVFSPSAAKRFHLGPYPRGTARRGTFDKPGKVAILCKVHQEMSATVSAKDGSYRLQDLPPGNYSITVWHERFKPLSFPAELSGGETISVDFDLTHRKVEAEVEPVRVAIQTPQDFNPSYPHELEFRFRDWDSLARQKYGYRQPLTPADIAAMERGYPPGPPR